MPSRVKLVVVFLLFFVPNAFSQWGTMRTRKVAVSQGNIRLDSVSIQPGSERVYCGGQLLTAGDYNLNYGSSTFGLKNSCSDTILITYRVLPIDFSMRMRRRDTSMIYSFAKGNMDRFLIQPGSEAQDILGTGGLQKSGSISRGVTFGNRQDLSVNSSLNLELTGYVAPNLQVLASVTDDNLPIQPEGNTNKLQEFDQVFIQLFNDRFRLQAGDFWIYKPEGYFLTYRKRGQGLTGEYFWRNDSSRVVKTQVSGALSKGKFNRQIIQGVEGNQGPYRLRGNENEPFIIILSGTERVYIDGRLLTRGQEFDYIIDYNTSELTFTARQLITKDSRIVVEFQYSDQNYARSLFQFSTSSKGPKLDWWFNAYTEQDSKNQPLQQNLTSEQKFLLSNIGDDLSLARATVIDSIGFSENLVQYALIDSLGYDSVLVYSVDPARAVYRVNFSFVGTGNGDYVFDQFNALGRVFRWVAPVNGVSVGDYAPVNLLITPKKQQLVTAGATYRFSERLKVTSELGMSGYDLNTFSRLDSGDDKGYSMRTRIEHNAPLRRDSARNWLWKNAAEIETLDPHFRPVEQYRAVEFDRDWNTRDQGYTGTQLFSTASTGLAHRQYGEVGIAAQQYRIGQDFEGYRGAARVNWRRKRLRADMDASALTSEARGNSNSFIRHRADVSQQFGIFRIGYKDDQELNRFRQGDSLLAMRSYSFFDYQGYLGIGDTSGNEVLLSYRERLDKRSDSTDLKDAAMARTLSGSWSMKKIKNQRLLVVANYRTLKILDSTIIVQQPENTTNGRIDHEVRLWKTALVLSTFYEVGAGLEQRKEFLYLKVNDGQGVYTWIDYNGDGIKDLNEFEIAAYPDQASYIRVFTPSNSYIRTYSNEYNQSLQLRPERVWANATGVKRMLARFSTQSRFRIQRKTNDFDGFNAYNPFVGQIEDSRLLSTSSNMRHSLFFNRTSTVFGMEYNFEDLRSKTLLATGFDGRSDQNHEISGRWNIKKEYSLLASYERGTKTSFVDYTTGRDYRLNYWTVKPSFVYQPTTSLRFSLDTRFSRKVNGAQFGGQMAEIRDAGFTSKFNRSQKGSFQAQFNFIQILFNGDANTPLGFELLEALKPGINYVWSVGYQRNVSKNLQLSVQYNGRQSEGARTIHAGGMEVKAFF
jgi:hypothetical protein